MSNDTVPLGPLLAALGLDFEVFFGESLWAC
jgi:hypothetical protein